MKYKIYLFISFLLFAFCFHCKSETDYNRIIPKTLEISDASFISFKSALAKAVDTRDSSFVYGILKKNISVGFDENGVGVNAFKKIWKPYNENSEFWTDLKKIMQIGCAQITSEGNIEIVYPFIFSEFPDSLDGFSHIVLTGEKIPVYNKPASNAKIICKLDYAILEVLDWNPKKWIKVTKFSETNDTGYVEECNTYPGAGGVRAFFIKENGKWFLSAFLTGD